jgi:chaperonin GroEL
MNMSRPIPGVPRDGGRKRALPAPRNPDVVLQPQTYECLLKGVNLIADAIRPTLGPLPRLVALEGLRATDTPSFLDDGATIARRIIEVRPRGADVGAMLLRQALWKMRDEAGDGSATAAVLYQALLQEGIRHVTQFECNPMLLRAGFEKGLRAVQACLREGAQPLMGKDNIAAIARGMCQEDREMAQLMGEIFDIVGPDGMIVVEGYEKLGLEREYIEGTYWKLSGWFSRLFVADKAGKRTVFEDAALLVTDFKITDPAMLVPPLERCVRAGIKRLVITAADISDAAIGLLVSNNQARTIETLVVRTPKTQEMERVASIEDIAILTGGKPFYSAAFQTLEDFRPEDLGYARRAWATDSLFGLYGGKGDPRQIRHRIAELRAKLSMADLESERKDLRMRMGRLSGGTVILRVGAIHETMRDARKEVAERAITGIRSALAGGVVLGGGMALLNAQSALDDLPACNDEERFACRILARALEEPLRAIAKNAGHMPDVIVERVRHVPPGCGFDARNGQMVDLRQAGILDPLAILQKALDVAISGAALALTTDVIIHHRKPVESIEP